jgi:F0F1-type ATP synthase assembly protein I
MARSPGDPKVPPLSIVQALAVASQFGITLVVAVVLGFFVGQWLDSRFSTGIIFTLIGVLLGLVGTATSTVNLYRATMRRAAREHAKDGNSGTSGT